MVFLSCVAILLPYLTQKILRRYHIFNDSSPSFCVMLYMNIMLCNEM